MDLVVWRDILRQEWGLNARLTRLEGEYDLNILAETDGGNDFVLKVMRPGCSPDLVDMQVQALSHLKKADGTLPFPMVVPTLSGQEIVECPDASGGRRLVWLLERLAGECYATCAPKSLQLIRELGQALGKCDAALGTFEHRFLARDFKWNLARADWIARHFGAIGNPSRKKLLSEVFDQYQLMLPRLGAMPVQAIHNDVNDYNILITGRLNQPRSISGILDLGDMCAAPRVCDLAIAGAYVVLDHDRPEAALAALVDGYHSANPLDPDELDLVWPLLRMRLAVSVVNSTLMARDNPDDPYVTVSQAPAWRFLETRAPHPRFAAARLRSICGLPVADGSDRVMAYLDRQRGSFAQVLGQSLDDAPMGSLSVEESPWPQNPFHLSRQEAARVGEEFKPRDGIWLGYYNEPRLIYTAPAFRKGRWKASDRRTVHLGIDVFAPAGTPVHAPLAGRVLVADYRDGHLDYGGVIILAHETPQGDRFYTLYGHLDPEFTDRLAIGDRIGAGQAFCRLGSPGQNGGWAPHLHLQLALGVDGLDADWPGAGDPDEMYLWHALCPNPAALLNLPDAMTCYRPTDKSAVLARRRAHFGRNLSLTYPDPVMLVRGWKHHLFDEWARPYLDAYNNVPHVGHAHPRIQRVVAAQLGRINSNTRYLHPAQTGFAEKILSRLPAPLNTCFFVNSGTEANELALRLARAHTGQRGMVTPDHGYHGNTTGAIDISAYKFNAPGGVGPSDWVELIDLPDDYRGRFRRDDPDRGAKFAQLTGPAIARLGAQGHGVAGFIAETFPSVAGQIIPPAGYLQGVYRHIRAAGGLCIADEVQTGLGRLGTHYFGFEQQRVVPDIVVLGKPIGNGHPLGVLVTTDEIAGSFANGPEFFSTFGGSTVSCLIGKEVLDIVEDEGLQENARAMGQCLLDGLRRMQEEFPQIGDVRGMGLFIGVDLIRDPDTLEEATQLCTYVKNRMRDHRILIGSEGPKDNVLKIRPPLTIDQEGVDMILKHLAGILREI